MRTDNSKRKRLEHDGRLHDKPDQRRQDAGRSRHAERPHSRQHRHAHASHSSLDAAGDQELDDQFHRLQATLSDRVENVKQREASLHADSQQLQQRLQGMDEREKHLLDRELSLKRMEDSLQLERACISRLQQDMLQQYNDIVVSLSTFEERFHRAQQLFPDLASTQPLESNLQPVDLPNHAASRQPEPSASGADESPKPLAAQALSAVRYQPSAAVMPEANLHSHDVRNAPGHMSQENKQSDAGLHNAQTAASQAWQQAPLNIKTPAHLPPNLPPHLQSKLPPDLQAKLSPDPPPNLSANSSANLSANLPADLPAEPLPDLSASLLGKTRGNLPAEQPANLSANLLAVPQGIPAVPVPEQQPSQPAQHAQHAQHVQHAQHAQQPPSAATTQAAGMQAENHTPTTHNQPSAQPPLTAGQVAAPWIGSPDPVFQLQTPAPTAEAQQLKAVLLSQEGNTASAQEGVTPTHLYQLAPQPVKLPTAQARQLKPVLLSRQGGTAGAQKITSPSRGQNSDHFRAETREKGGRSEEVKEREGEVGSPSSSSMGGGRGRGVGRGRGRARGRSGLHRVSFSEPAGDLDEAVQALRATTEGAEPSTDPGDIRCTNANALLDDDLRPSFMRHVAASQKLPNQMAACTDVRPERVTGAKDKSRAESRADSNPRPTVRRRTDADAKLSATDILQREVPDLLEMLQQKGLADQVGLLEEALPGALDGHKAEEDRYASMHRILARVCEGKSNSWQGCSASGIRASGGEDTPAGKHEYCLLALEHLLERAAAFSESKQPVRWGWCRQLSSFIFVFESANRIVVEKPCYGHATYFFDLEEPLPVTDQVQRLIAVLSVPGASRRKLLEDCSLDPGPEVSLQERQQLKAAGWKPGSTIRSLLNFTGDRMFHQSADVMTGHKPMLQNAVDYKEKIAKVLLEGASGGRITKI